MADDKVNGPNPDQVKTREKHAVAADLADGIDPEYGVRARQEARAAAAKARKSDAESSASSPDQVRSQEPKGRDTSPRAKG